MTARKKLRKAENIGRRLRGVSAFGFGASWEYPPSERETVRKLLIFLEDRRALFAPYDVRVARHSLPSSNRIREECTETLSSLPETSPGVGPIRAIRAACRRFIDDQRVRDESIFRRVDEGSFEQQAAFFIALGELRAFIGNEVAILAALYDLELDADLASIVPAEDAETER
jgi:hypothetical protein